MINPIVRKVKVDQDIEIELIENPLKGVIDNLSKRALYGKSSTEKYCCGYFVFRNVQGPQYE